MKMMILDALKMLFSRKQHCKTSLQKEEVEVGSNLLQKQDDHDSFKLEVNFIKTLLERKFKRKFQTRIKVEGCFGDAKSFTYYLMLDDYCNSELHDYHAEYGYSTHAIQNVYHAFLDEYWARVQRCNKFDNNPSEFAKLDKFDRRRIETFRDMLIVKSREELIMKAALEGIVLK